MDLLLCVSIIRIFFYDYELCAQGFVQFTDEKLKVQIEGRFIYIMNDSEWSHILILYFIYR